MLILIVPLVLLCDLTTAVTTAAPGADCDRHYGVTDAGAITGAVRQRIAQALTVIDQPMLRDGGPTVTMADPGQARDHQLSVTDAAAIEAPVLHNRTSSCNAMALLPRIDEVLAAIEQHSFATQQQETDDE